MVDSCNCIKSISPIQMDVVQKLYIIVQIAQALFYLHTSSPALVHSDVKPCNILVSNYIIIIIIL